jgi:ERCC4-type nuclease
MPFVLVIDSNENAHSVTSGHGSRRDALAAALDPVRVVARPLKAGDYAINWTAADDDEDVEVERTLALLEHKRESDLVASIKGVERRYVSQAGRLEATGVPYVFWVISKAPLFDPTDAACIEAALVHLSVAYPHTRVLRVESTGAPFVSLVRSLMKYLRDTVIEGNALAEAPLHVVAQERGAKVRLDAQPVVWVETLTIPRGLGRQAAKAIAARYPSYGALMRAYRETRVAFAASEAVAAAAPKKKGASKKKRTLDDALDAMLEDVPLPSGKRIGPAASRIIRRTLVAPGDDE